jgi:hypothetical protein
MSPMPLARMAKNAVKQGLKRLGYDLVPLPPAPGPTADLDEGFVRVYREMKPLGGFDMKLFTTYKAVDYIVRAGIDGDIVECGVYRGKQILMIAHTLKNLGVVDRDIYLYDTFAGMTKPTEDDYAGDPAHFVNNLTKWEQGRQPDGSNAFKFASVEEVQGNVYSSGYPRDRFHVVKGDVLETVTPERHDRIALLRLDTDWYASTTHEIACLYDRLAVGGVLIVDDYGRWRGSRKAIDQHFAFLGARAPLLVRTGTSERVCIKVQP